MILLDNFPFDLTGDFGDYSDNVELISNPGWAGPQTPETEQARIEGIKKSWEDAGDRRLEHSMRLKAMRPTMPQGHPHEHGMTTEHKAKLSTAAMGNTNSKKPHKYPATRKKPCK